MSLSKAKHGVLLDLAPPSTKRLEIKEKLHLLLELIWFAMLILPNILWALYRKIFPPPEKSLKGHVALVTGAGRGLGRGLALALAQEGCSVAVVDLNMANAEDTVKQIQDKRGKAKAYCTNVAILEEVSALREAVTKDLGPVYLLVNNAGVLHAGDVVEDCKESVVKLVIGVNLMSSFWMAKEFLPSMKERNSGHIVAICSCAGFAYMEKCSPYVASKFGLRGFMEVLRTELEARRGNQIKTTTVFPYFINTSADYVDRWDLRYPELSISEVEQATVTGIKRDYATVTIPEIYYYICHLLWLGPQALYDKLHGIMYVRLPNSRSWKNKTIAFSRGLQD